MHTVSNEPGLVILIVGLVVIGFKLRKVHDAYFIKTEFTAMMALGIVFLIFFVVLVFSNQSALYSIGNWVLLILCNILAFLRYVDFDTFI